MDWFTGVIAYLLIWWTALFVVLPWGSNRLAQDPVPGQVHSAPDFPHLKRKFMITTALSVVLWFILYALVSANLIDFRQIAGGMIKMDTGS